MSQQRGGFTSPFPPLQLAAEDAAQLAGLASAFVRKAMGQYEHFVFKDQYQVDARRWKPVLQREAIQAFAERRRSGSDFAAHDDFPDAPVTNAADLPALLLCGTLEGQLDDALYGDVCPTLSVMRIKTSYIDDQLAGSAVLETLAAPTEHEPFKSLTIKWFEKGRPLHVRAVAKNRDFVYMEATGVELLSNGERAGYHLMHSVHFPQTRELDTVVRGNMSVCGIYRQRTPELVDVFITGVLNPAGGLMRSIIIKSAAAGLMSAANLMRCAEHKKLAWLLRRRRELFKAQRQAAQLTEAALGSVDARCACSKRPALTLIFKTSSSPTSCRVCLQRLCSSCRVRKKLSFINRDQQLEQTDVTFCANCVAEAARLDAMHVAKDELARPQDVTWSDAFTHSGSSSRRSNSNASSSVKLAY